MLKKSGPKRQHVPVLSFWLAASLPPTLRAIPDFSALLGSLMGVREVPSALGTPYELQFLLIKA
jgi:hypothetical protein